MKKLCVRMWLILFAVLCLGMSGAVSVNAKTAYKNKWVTNSSGRTFYYDEAGKKLKGLQKIGEKYYYFDAKGIQRTGWIKIGDDYYFFNIGTKKKGYRVSSKKVNGITLKKGGKAKLNSYSKRKLPLLIKANKIVQSITNDKMTKKQKLKKAFDYTKANLKCTNMGSFRSGSNWDMTYAEIAFNSGRADCYGYGAYFAYLANAVGYTANVVSSGGHGWTEIGGRIYDANWALADRRYSYFDMSSSLSGVGGRPNYARYRLYVKTV